MQLLQQEITYRYKKDKTETQNWWHRGYQVMMQFLFFAQFYWTGTSCTVLTNDIIYVTDKQQWVGNIPILQNVYHCFIFDTCSLMWRIKLPRCYVEEGFHFYVCDWACVLGECWQMMVFGCRAHRYICGRGEIVSLHVNEPLCHSCVITARNDTNQPFSPQRHRVGEMRLEGDIGGGVILERARLDVLR